MSGLLVSMITVGCGGGSEASSEETPEQGAGGVANVEEVSTPTENRCETSSASIEGSVCLFSFSDCADGSEYRIDCDETRCSCFVNGSTTHAFMHANDCQAKVADGGELMVSACGFEIVFDPLVAGT